MSDDREQENPEQPKDAVEDLNDQPITEHDAQSVKGGRLRYIGEIKGESGDNNPR